MVFRRPKKDIDDLVAESQRLRDELMRTAAKLELFAAQLAVQAARLREASRGEPDGE